MEASTDAGRQQTSRHRFLLSVTLSEGMAGRLYEGKPAVLWQAGG